MSEIRVENIIGETGVDAVNFTKGVNVTGIATATNVSVGSSVTAATFHGSGASLTGISAGITVAQQWRITEDHAIPASNSFITSNWESVDTDGYGAIGSMSESSGVFTFPLTGIYLIRFNGAHTTTGSIILSLTAPATALPAALPALFAIPPTPFATAPAPLANAPPAILAAPPSAAPTAGSISLVCCLSLIA